VITDTLEKSRLTRRTGAPGRWRKSSRSVTPPSGACCAPSVCSASEATIKLSRDPLFVEKVRDMVQLYPAPPDRALVLSVDEKSQLQALDPTASILPMTVRLARALHV
jgi:hypothetical protein